MMKDAATLAMGGGDARCTTDYAVSLDERGRQFGDAALPVISHGYRLLLSWFAGFGAIVGVGVESTGN